MSRIVRFDYCFVVFLINLKWVLYQEHPSTQHKTCIQFSMFGANISFVYRWHLWKTLVYFIPQKTSGSPYNYCNFWLKHHTCWWMFYLHISAIPVTLVRSVCDTSIWPGRSITAHRWTSTSCGRWWQNRRANTTRNTQTRHPSLTAYAL